MGEYAVEFRDVVKVFPTPEGSEVIAVNRVNLQITHGEFFSLLGPSGCGKTTSLRMMAGFEWPTHGDVLIDDVVMGRIPPYQRPVNTVFQSYALFEHMTVFQNVAFGLEMEKRPKEEIKRRVEEALDMVKLSGMGKRKPKQLSGGQQQRIALARALIKRPRVLLLDEPLGALDLKLRKEMQLELKSLQEQVGITFIYVTHDQEEALTMSDRIAVMSQGNVLQIDTPVVIYERPNCRFVADFIGATNFLYGKVVSRKGDKAMVAVPELGIEITGLASEGMESGKKAVISIRPEKMHIAQKPDAGQNAIAARVVETAYIGSDTRFILNTADGTRLNVWEQNTISTLDLNASYYHGQEVWAVFPHGNTLVLPE
ncbi:MAG: ABC transporter ATP-binding protein [Anaerolineales bacterium]|nr:ABC transporter ATP-binding protein [Anaerolineales bacterium]